MPKRGYILADKIVKKTTYQARDDVFPVKVIKRCYTKIADTENSPTRFDQLKFVDWGEKV